jgi:hypothetical protein
LGSLATHGDAVERAVVALLASDDAATTAAA